MFDPLKESWKENGPEVTEAVKAAFTAMKQLAGDVGASFMQVWNMEGYGKRITDDLADYGCQPQHGRSLIWLHSWMQHGWQAIPAQTSCGIWEISF
ncbi:MAG: hypothetical protein ACLR8P_13995 [Clostridium fessum]